MGNDGLLNENDEIEIDLLQLLRALKKRIVAILAAGVLVGGIAGAFSKFVLTPQYTSTAMVYILSKETTLTSLADLQIGSQLTKDYKIIVTSRPVLEDVIQKLNLDLTYKELLQKIEIGNPADTRILSITAQDPDPAQAKSIADAVAGTSSDYIGDIMEMVPPKIIEEGVVATEKSSPSNSKNALIGALLGMVLVCGITVVEVIMNDTVQTEEDVEKYLGLSVLASVPLREGEQEEDKDAATMRRSKAGKQDKDKKRNTKKRGMRK
ncbi:MAG: Wzz/FepE/Etk N-terminal domain-containing protein [Eubacteriales bacterium]|nr:Wzz/FepE/Etk N-terminal domain-containing protein [Eubacteriales bacterium]